MASALLALLSLLALPSLLALLVRESVGVYVSLGWFFPLKLT
ncbi:hypothetical protein [Corynebacterium sp. LK11]|nr:hypothetical protein [Corynebacterium sp. LK11]